MASSTDALPLITWLPPSAKDVSVENDSGTPLRWVAVSGSEPTEVDVASTNQSPSDTGRPVTERKFVAQLRIRAASGTSTVEVDEMNGGPDLHRPTVDAKETWYFHGFWKASTASTDVAAILRVEADGVSASITTTSATIGTSWTEFLVMADVASHAGSPAWTISPRLQIDSGQSGRVLRVRGMSAGRCLNFSKNVVFTRDITRKAVMSTSISGVVQTDLWHNKSLISMSSFDEDYDFWRNALDFFRDASVGVNWGFANDRTDHSKNWMPQLVLTQDGGFSHIPVGAERYRIDVKGQQQVYALTNQPMGVAV